MRLFVALEVPEQWREAARAARRAFELELDAPMRWVDPARLHLTVRFLGEVDAQDLAPLQQALSERVPPVDVELRLDGPGTFGPHARTEVAWLGVGGDANELRALAECVEGGGGGRRAAAGAARVQPPPHAGAGSGGGPPAVSDGRSRRPWRGSRPRRRRRSARDR